MKYTIESKKPTCKIIFELDNSEWNAALDKAYNKDKGKYSLQGFRKGHVPRKYIESMYGASVFYDEAFNLAFPELYSHVLDDNKDIYPVETPNLDIIDNSNGIKFSAEFTVKPEAQIGKYTGLKINAISGSVTDEDITREIELARDKASRKVEVSRAIAVGDFVMLDYSGKIDGVQFAGGTATNQELEIGSKTFIDTFEEQLVGLSAGDDKSITVKFPDDYHADDLKGKDAIFDCKIRKVLSKQMPNLDDDFVKDISTFDNLAEYKADIERKLKEASEKNADIKNIDTMLTTITNATVVDIPNAMIETQLDSYIHEFEHRLAASGLDLQSYLQYSGMSLEDMRSMRKDDAVTTIRMRLTVERIIEVEKIIAPQSEIDLKLAQRADNFKKPLQEYKKGVTDGELEYISNEILTAKVIEFLKTHNEFVYTDGKTTASNKQSSGKKTNNSTNMGKDGKATKTTSDASVKSSASKPQTVNAKDNTDKVSAAKETSTKTKSPTKK